MIALRSPGSFASWARRVTATLLAVAQLAMVLASLTELRGELGGRRHGGLGEPPVRVGTAAFAAGDQRAQHDEATCPACIMRSLHARLEALAPLPISVADQHSAAAPAPASVPRVKHSFSNFSRAPPVVG